MRWVANATRLAIAAYIVPSRIEVTPGSNSGHNDEKNRLRKSLLPDHCYVLDRWYVQFALWNDIVAADSSYVCRIRDNSNLDLIVEERAVSPAAAAAGVLRDIVVDLGVNSKPDARPNHRVRVILVKCEPHTKRGGRKGGTAGSSQRRGASDCHKPPRRAGGNHC